MMGDGVEAGVVGSAGTGATMGAGGRPLKPWSSRRRAAAFCWRTAPLAEGARVGAEAGAGAGVEGSGVSAVAEVIVAGGAGAVGARVWVRAALR
jgi:hypothetical protein